MSKIERYHLLEAVGGQVLPVLLALPDVEVEAGTRPTFTDAQVAAAVEADDWTRPASGGCVAKVAVAAPPHARAYGPRPAPGPAGPRRPDGPDPDATSESRLAADPESPDAQVRVRTVRAARMTYLDA